MHKYQILFLPRIQSKIDSAYTERTQSELNLQISKSKKGFFSLQISGYLNGLNGPKNRPQNSHDCVALKFNRSISPNFMLQELTNLL